MRMTSGPNPPINEARKTDLPIRVASALVMLAIAAAAFWAGGRWLDLFIVLVALAAFGEFASLVLKATTKILARIAGLLAGTAYFALATLFLLGFPETAVILVIGAVICVDTFAYFFGRTIGGPKIAPRISPSKTWAGLLGGVVGATLWIVLMLVFVIGTEVAPVTADGTRSVMTALDWSLTFIVGAIVAVAAQTGDFFESWLKRRAGVKDSSRLIPGHGGFFDRVDGLLPVVILAGLVQSYL